MVNAYAEIKKSQYVSDGQWEIRFHMNKTRVNVSSITFEAKNLEDAIESININEYSKIVITYTDNG